MLVDISLLSTSQACHVTTQSFQDSLCLPPWTAHRQLRLKIPRRAIGLMATCSRIFFHVLHEPLLDQAYPLHRGFSLCTYYTDGCKETFTTAWRVFETNQVMEGSWPGGWGCVLSPRSCLLPISPTPVIPRDSPHLREGTRSDAPELHSLRDVAFEG